MMYVLQNEERTYDLFQEEELTRPKSWDPYILQGFLYNEPSYVLLDPVVNPAYGTTQLT